MVGEGDIYAYTSVSLKVNGVVNVGPYEDDLQAGREAALELALPLGSLKATLAGEADEPILKSSEVSSYLKVEVVKYLNNLVSYLVVVILVIQVGKESVRGLDRLTVSLIKIGL